MGSGTRAAGSNERLGLVPEVPFCKEEEKKEGTLWSLPVTTLNPPNPEKPPTRKPRKPNPV